MQQLGIADQCWQIMKTLYLAHNVSSIKVKHRILRGHWMLVKNVGTFRKKQANWVMAASMMAPDHLEIEWIYIWLPWHLMASIQLNDSNQGPYFWGKSPCFKLPRNFCLGNALYMAKPRCSEPESIFCTHRKHKRIIQVKPSIGIVGWDDTTHQSCMDDIEQTASWDSGLFVFLQAIT